MKYLKTLAIFLVLGCSSQNKNLPTNFDFGTTNVGVYKNDYFKLQVNFNPDWIVQDRQQVNQLAETGAKIMTGEDKALKSVVDASKVNTAYLLTVFKHELGAAVDFNPSFMIVAENVKNFPGVKSGSDYLFHSRKLLQQSQMAYYFDKDVFEVKVGNRNFHVLEAKVDYLDKTIIQEYMSTVTNGFSLTFIISYTNADEREELYNVVDKIQI